MIKNLTQLKVALQPGVQFLIKEHCRPDSVGQRREVNIANTQGMYTIIPGDPKHRVSNSNCGKGSWLAWNKAKHWEFNGTNICSVYDSEEQHTPDHLVMTLEVLGGGF